MATISNVSKNKVSIADVIINIIIIILGALCFVPLLHVVATSFSGSAAASAGKVGLVPVNFSLEPYRRILADGQFWRSFKISVLRVIFGTSLNIFLCISMAYPLSKDKSEFKHRKIYMGLLLLVMLFNGGVVPTYLVVYKLGLIDTLAALILPGAVAVGNVILMMNFFRGIPKSIEEAAEIDGANPLQTLIKIYLPMSTASIATITLFSIVGHWNDFFSGILYMNSLEKYPLQTYIQLLTADFDPSKVQDIQKLEKYLQVSGNNLNAAKIVVSVIPLMLIYPFLQKYFTDGIVVGAVKG